MSDYCYECAQKHLGQPGELNDFSGLASGENKLEVLCEGCGIIWVDSAGRKVLLTEEDRKEIEKQNENALFNPQVSKVQA